MPIEPSLARRRLQIVGDFFATQRHLIAVRDGVVGALPLVLVGSLFLLAAQPPIAALAKLVAPYTPTILVPYRMLGGAVAIYVTFCTAYSLAKSYQLDAMASGLLAMAAYLICALPSPGLSNIGSGQSATQMLPLVRLGAGGIFTGLGLAIGSVELTRFFVTHKWIIRLPDTTPEVVGRSFIALVPAFAVVMSTFVVVHVAGVDLIRTIEQLAQPFLVATGSVYAAVLVVLTDSTLWLLGVHASAALATMKPLWEAMLIQNMEAAASHSAHLPNIAPQPFYLWWVWQGGSGATLPLAILLTRAKSAQLRSLGRIGFLPAFCNINEPILFGAPVVLNATLAIPFFAVPILSVLTAYTCFSLGWVTRPYLEMPWTLPAPIGAFLSTGGDWRAVALQLFNLGIGLALYWPFVRRYDLRLKARETKIEHNVREPATNPTSYANSGQDRATLVNSK